MLRVIIAIFLLRHEIGGDCQLNDSKMIVQDDKSVLSISRNPKPYLELVLDIPQETMIENQFKKQRNNQSRRKEGRLRSKNKAITNDELTRIDRNNEKDKLVRNRTIEILKSGVRILNANNGHLPVGDKSSINLNETLLEKILSSGASKTDILISPSGTYKLPIGGNIYKSKDSEKEESTEGTIRKNDSEYEYDYDGLIDKDQNSRNDVGKSYENPYPFGHNYESVSVDNNVKNILDQIIMTLRNLSHHRRDIGCSAKETPDPCERWLACKHHLEMAFVGQNVLPSCPCHYPSNIFYNDAIWDHNKRRFFRWRDASNEGERLDIYKPGAVYCIRSLLAQTGTSISSQQCCYDGKLRLLTRGSGAGTINFVSPDVSKALHDTVDVLPWRLCKGDFTRYNSARHPDNGNNCPVNPNEEQYDLQVRFSKYY